MKSIIQRWLGFDRLIKENIHRGAELTECRYRLSQAEKDINTLRESRNQLTTLSQQLSDRVRSLEFSTFNGSSPRKRVHREPESDLVVSHVSPIKVAPSPALDKPYTTQQ